MDEVYTCRECGKPMVIGPCGLESSDGVSHHINVDGNGIDFEADADHVAVVEDE